MLYIPLPSDLQTIYPNNEKPHIRIWPKHGYKGLRYKGLGFFYIEQDNPAPNTKIPIGDN